MPTKKQLQRRGGVVRVRTKNLGDGRYAHVYVVRKKGKRGGKTMVGEVKRSRRKGG